ncbi:MAG: TetR/AcrR family transcriptional regulator [Gammaproteobacteria bacterium]
MSITNRAVTDTQKQARRADILKVAMARFDALPYDALTMDSIAADADVAKGTLYLYFHSKEEVFLALYEQELERWFDELDAGLEKNNHNASFDSVVLLISDSLEDRPAFLRLIAILHTVLERNVDHATVRRFKTRLKERVLHTGALLEACLRFLKPGQGADLLLKINALVIGFQHLAEPSEVVEAVLKEPELVLFRVNLTEQLLGTLRTLLMGLAYQAKYGNEK